MSTTLLISIRLIFFYKSGPFIPYDLSLYGRPTCQTLSIHPFEEEEEDDDEEGSLKHSTITKTDIIL